MIKSRSVKIGWKRTDYHYWDLYEYLLTGRKVWDMKLIDEIIEELETVLEYGGQSNKYYFPELTDVQIKVLIEILKETKP